MFDLVHQGVKPQLNPPGFIPLGPIIVVKPKKLAQAKPRLSQMSKKFHQYLAGRAPRIISALDCNLPEMGKLSNSVEECVPINVGFLHASSQLLAVIKVTEVYDDVGDKVNVVAGGGGVRQSRINTPEVVAINIPLGAEICF